MVSQRIDSQGRARCQTCGGIAFKGTSYCRRHQPVAQWIIRFARFVWVHRRMTCVILILAGLAILIGWRLFSDRFPAQEAPVASPTPVSSPTEIPPTETPVATPTVVPPTPAPRKEDFIPHSILPYGINREEGFTKGEGYLVLRLFNGDSSLDLDGPCIEAGRQYLVGFFAKEGFEVPIWNLKVTPVVVPADTVREIQGVKFPISTAQAYQVQGRIGDQEVAGLLLELKAIPGISLDQLACDQDQCGPAGGRCLYTARAQTTRDRVYFWVEWENQGAVHSVTFAGRCGNLAAKVGRLPPPREVIPTPTATTVGPSPTPTRSPTPSPSVTPSPTLTPTPTSTPVTPTPTVTPSPTATWTPTPTSTPIPTPTPIVEYGGTAGVRWSSCSGGGYMGTVTASAWKLVNGTKVAEGQTTITVGPYPPCTTASGMVTVPLSDGDSYDVGWQATTPCPPTPTPPGPTPTPLPTPAPTETPPPPQN